MRSKDYLRNRKVLTCLMASASLLAQPNLQAATATAIQLPTGGTYTAGAGVIKSSGNAVTVNQSTLRGIVDWNSFSLGQGNSITFKNGSGATLNLVNGGPLSSLFGSLIATGSVYLINPAGVLIGSTGRVNTGGDFLASTLKISPDTFMQGGALDFKGKSQATVVNLGNLYSSGGSIFLIGYQVSNSGSIAAANGSAGLAAGSEILLKDTSGDQRIFVKGQGSDLTNSGTIAAAQAELRTKGGNIYALAGNNSSIAATGTATINGKTWIIADGGNTVVSGSVSAQNNDGTGGSIETSGHNLAITGASVKTGQGGNWLLDPVDLTVDSAAATTIQNSLATTNVTLQTTATTASGPGNQNSSGVGDIIVNSPISWASNQTLTLDAYHSATVNSSITSSGASAGLTVLTNHGGTGGYFTVLSPITLASTGSLNINGHAYTLLTTATALQNVTAATVQYYALDADLDLSTFGNFVPISNNVTPGFLGIMEGLGHTLSNMTIVSVGSSATGMFAYNAGTIENLILNGGSATENQTNTRVAMLVGSSTAAGLVNNVKSSGSVTASGNGFDPAGLVSQNYGAIVNSSSSGAVNTGMGSNYVGGLVGYSGGTITGSSATGAVTCLASCGDAGGLVGETNGAVSKSFATGLVTAGANSNSVGGLIGMSGNTTSSAYATGSVMAASGSQKVGGLIGQNTAPISNSYAIGSVSVAASGSSIGGLVGSTSGAITNSYSISSVSPGSGSTNVGGFVGSKTGTPSIVGNYWDITASGQTTDSGGATGLTTLQWISQGPVANSASGWDFTNTWVAGYPYPVLKSLPYVVNTFSSSRTYGSTSNTAITSTILDQNGNNAASLVSGTLTPFPSQSYPASQAAGTYSTGGSGQSVSLGYQLAYVGSLTINPLTLTVGGTTIAANKVYDGTTLATVSGGSVTGIIAGDSVTLSQSGAFSDKNAGIGKTVNYSNTLTGTSAANYTLSILSGTTAANITPLTLTDTFTVANKTYDGTTSAAGTVGALSGAVSGDQVALTAGSYQFTDANAGAAKSATATGFSLTGTDAGNYTLQLNQSGSAAISPATLYYTANGGVSRGFGLANPTFTGSVSGLVGSDTLASTTTGSPLFTSPATFSSDIGTYAILGSGLTLTTGNYTLAQAASNTNAFAIQPIAVSIGSVSRTSGSPNPTFTVSYSGVSNPYLQQLLASLQLVTNAPGSDAPGAYQITALVPAQFASDIIVQPGTLTITASLGASPGLAETAFPAVLQTQPVPPPAPLPLISGISAGQDQVLPPNSISQFQVVITPSPTWIGGNFQGSANFSQPLSQASFAEFAPDGHGKNDRSTYAAGAKQP